MDTLASVTTSEHDRRAGHFWGGRMTTVDEAQRVHHEVVAVFIGVPKVIEHANGDWTTALYKERTQRRLKIGKANIAGDRQADLLNHGGEDKAICVYPEKHYRFWRIQLGKEVDVGAFGENFSATADETEVCVGDRFMIGTAEVEVSQPRRPCWKIGRRWESPQIPVLMRESGFSGWYLRVVRTGFVQAGEPAELIARPYPYWTVSEAFKLRFGDDADPEQLHALASCSALPDSWRLTLENRAKAAAGANRL